MTLAAPELDNPLNHPNSGAMELRNAVRFPLSIPVRIHVEDWELDGMTENISATGVLFTVDRPLSVGMRVRYTMTMPADAMGTGRDVVVHCGGRVVRCTFSGVRTLAAAVIDEYYFSQ